MLIDFSCERPQTEFAPVWNMYGWGVKFQDEDAIDDMRNWVIENEKRIVNTYPPNPSDDAGTGLGKNSLTAKYIYFNLMHETRFVPSFVKFREFLWAEYQNFMRTLQYPIRDCHLNAWANVVRRNQSMTSHHHGTYPWSYLSANMHLDNYETKTFYRNSITHDEMTFNNVKGGCVIFPSCMRHGVTKHKMKERRVSIAMDIYPKGLAPVANQKYPLIDLKIN